MTTTDTTSVPTGADAISDGHSYLGIEFGSTRIKATLVDGAGRVLGSGSYGWENEYAENNWTYSLEDVHVGLQACYADLAANVRATHDVELTSLGGIGVSAMMHGYLAFGGQELLVPFRTWRNTYTTDASAILTETFGQNMPLRWSGSHLLHAALGKEEHVGRIDFVTTLAGYVHWLLTGRKVLGIGDASGMFPIDPAVNSFRSSDLDAFDALDAMADVPWKVADVLPQVLVAGQDAGSLTADGAKLLDPSGTLRPGAPAAAPEGDAGTGMVATNSVRPHTGNVSAGTSAFAMVVLDEPVRSTREEIDPVTTPAGDPVAMIHTNNCTGDIDAWVRVFAEVAAMAGAPVDTDELYASLFRIGMEGDADAGGVISYNYLSGEHQTGVHSGRPLTVRTQDARFTLANFMRAQLYSAFGALAVGMDVLLHEEKVVVDSIFAHGGIFRTPGVAQQVLADALGVPVVVGTSAGEGGPWGMALLAAYTADGGGLPLTQWLDERIFSDAELSTLEPDVAGSAGHRAWLERYRAGLPVEKLAGELLD